MEAADQHRNWELASAVLKRLEEAEAAKHRERAATDIGDAVRKFRAEIEQARKLAEDATNASNANRLAHFHSATSKAAALAASHRSTLWGDWDAYLSGVGSVLDIGGTSFARQVNGDLSRLRELDQLREQVRSALRSLERIQPPTPERVKGSE